ncbi:MAG TPA: hypothetical protein VNJ12_09340 [Candidatus Dormibacteraeota bacterium]|nr:hypothetical protein [Candidatus Dormibacteraeota bacterium]
MNAAEVAEIAHARPYRDGFRGPCPVHHGKSGTAFDICQGEAGRVLIRCWRGCPTADILRALGLDWADLFPGPRAPNSQAERERQQQIAQRAESAAWALYDRLRELKCFYRDNLHRVEALQRRTGEEITAALTDAEREVGWIKLQRLAPVATFYHAAFDLAFGADPAIAAAFALASPTERRTLIFQGVSDATDAAAA